jgi:hypothetical protein
MNRVAYLAFAAAFTLGCADSGPVAPNAARLGADSAPTLGKSSGAVENYSTPVSFTIPGGTCGMTTTVTGTGVFHIVTRSTQSGNGDWHVSFSWSAHGTATGEDGSTYRFNYAINAKSVDPTGPDDLVTIELIDHFNLLGQRGAPDLKVFLKGTFEYPAFAPIGDATIRGPGIACDPI